MNRAYRIVNESVTLNEMNKAAIAGLGIGATFGGWFLNRVIRTNKVLKAYPNPADLKRKLMSSDNPNVAAIGNSMDPNMDSVQYKQYVTTITNPKMGAGKAILMAIFGSGWLIPAYQLGKAAVHSAESGDTILQRGIDKGRIFDT